MTPPCMVKVFSKGRTRHGVPAMLLRIEGKWAIVKPRNHGHTDRVPLSTVREWRSRNAPPSAP